MDLLHAENLFALQYADDNVSLWFDTPAKQTELKQLTMNVRRHDMCFSVFECKILLQDQQEPMPTLTVDSEQLELVGNSMHSSCCVSVGGGVGGEMDPNIVRDRTSYANLNHL
ncbi:unnamed protein product [Schistosoma rodhaini]|uniref:Reverse transcriptase domain-containing protein n=1 Tax=Schistosoma rodhaini TaxID=6188 RepID=A0AA85EVE3_9TREM|nr:unnamed protein product [Schistosoma rodhaini]